MEYDEIVGNLDDVENITDEDKNFLKTVSKKVIIYFETVKGKGTKTRVILEEDSDEEFELVRKRKRKTADAKQKSPITKWYESMRYALKRVSSVIEAGDEHLSSLTKRQRNTLIKDSDTLLSNLSDLKERLKN